MRKKHAITLYWNRQPGKFVNKLTGDSMTVNVNGITSPAFRGSIQEWYETLVETLNDLSNKLRAHAGDKAEAGDILLKVDPDTFCILQASILFKPGNDPSRGTVSTMNSELQVIASKHAPRFNPVMEYTYKVGAKQRIVVGDVRILEN